MPRNKVPRILLRQLGGMPMSKLIDPDSLALVRTPKRRALRVFLRKLRRTPSLRFARDEP